MMRGLFVLTCIAFMGCSSSDDTGASGVHNRLNACATKNASYLTTCTEISGNCGPLTDEISNTDAAGISKIESITCASATLSGCTGKATDCVETVSNGCKIGQTYSTDFAEDGSSADSTATMWVTCPDGSSCKSTYTCTLTRL